MIVINFLGEYTDYNTVLRIHSKCLSYFLNDVGYLYHFYVNEYTLL